MSVAFVIILESIKIIPSGTAITRIVSKKSGMLSIKNFLNL